jgi:hypothetical protein
MSRLKYLLTSCVLALTVSFGLTVAGPSNATTLLGPTSAASGFNGLVVDTVTYDVTFVHDSYNSVYASTTPTFLGNSTGASDAMIALVSALRGSDVTGLVGLVLPDYYTVLYLVVPYSVPAGNFVSAAACGTDVNSICQLPPFPPPWGTGTPYVDASTTYDQLDYAVFTAAAETPLPAALPLFASGLGGLGLLSWRRRKKKAAAVAA